MNKVIMLTLGVVLLSAGLVFVQPTPPAAQTAVQTVEVGNKICPVSGRPVGQMGPAVKHEYKGKIYNLCCGMCPRTFDSDPAKYAKIAEDEVASQNK